MNKSELLHPSRADVERVGLSMSEMIDNVEQVFLEKGNGRVEMPPKPGIYTREDSFIHAMPAYVYSLKAAGIKCVANLGINF